MSWSIWWAYDVEYNTVGLEMMKNGQTVKGQGKEFGFYPGNIDSPVRFFFF